MGSEFSIGLDWSSGEHGPEEIRQTSAVMQIRVNGCLVTRVEDEWSRSVVHEVRLSAYPLALWFASSWWRLGWEPAPASPGGPGWEPSHGAAERLSWRMAHEMASAGHGYLWPRLVFRSDGEVMDVAWRSTDLTDAEPLRYLDSGRDLVPLDVFVEAVAGFINTVLARLNVVGVLQSDLSALWQEVCEERSDPGAARYRQLEARLGFDPDEAPAGAADRLLSLSAEAGKDAVYEIASACAGDDVGGALDAVAQWSKAPGVQGRILPHGAVIRPSGLRGRPPWARGWEMARWARAAWGIGRGPVGDRDLSAILSISAAALSEPGDGIDRPPLALAIRSGSAGSVKFLFRSRNQPGRRFEAARLLGDSLTASRGDHWLPATKTATARQKFQRAFAAEFLAPRAEIEDYLGRDLSPEAIEDTGAYFGVWPGAILSHLSKDGAIAGF